MIGIGPIDAFFVGVGAVALATAELTAAAAIWLSRARRTHGGGWSDRDDPEGPGGGPLPDEHWRRWERQLEPAHRPSGGGAGSREGSWQ